VLTFAIGLVFISLLSWYVYLSNRIAAGYLAPNLDPTTFTIKSVDQKKLEADLKLLSDQQAGYLKIKNNPTQRIDPAL
jgi:hypothetical protein